MLARGFWFFRVHQAVFCFCFRYKSSGVFCVDWNVSAWSVNSRIFDTVFWPLSCVLLQFAPAADARQGPSGWGWARARQLRNSGYICIYWFLYIKGLDWDLFYYIIKYYIYYYICYYYYIIIALLYLFCYPIFHLASETSNDGWRDSHWFVF